MVQANSGAQKIVAVGNSSEVSPTAGTTGAGEPGDPPAVVETPGAVPTVVPTLEVEQPEPTSTRKKQGDDALAQVPDPVTVPTAQPTSRPTTKRPEPSPTKTTKKKTNLVEPDPDPTGSPSPSPSATANPTKKPTVKPTAAPRPNPYTAAKVCGSGYKIINAHTLGSNATIYLLYSSAAGKNCVVTLSRLAHPGKVQMNAVLQVKDGASASNPGKFTAYAGPVRLAGAKKCVIWGGSWGSASWKSGWSHCG